MYPQQELNRLVARKLALRQHITLHRMDCAEAAGRVIRPLEWLDRMMAFWRGLPPLTKVAAVPLGLLVQRVVSPRFNTLDSLLRWGPLAFATIRGLRAARPAR